jgi:hypothetical protein
LLFLTQGWHKCAYEILLNYLNYFERFKEAAEKHADMKRLYHNPMFPEA